MFLQLYWHYIATLLIAYLAGKAIYTLFQFKKRKNGNNLNEDHFKTPDELAELHDEPQLEDEENFSPALPKDLKHIPFSFERLPEDVMLQKSLEFYKSMNKRRSIRYFSSDPVPIEVLYNIIRVGGTSPSGAHTEPWTFALITSLEVKQKIREIIENQEEINYRKRMGKTWTDDLRPLRTTWIKKYLTEAPALILVFKQLYSYKPDGTKKMHYYHEQSVAIAAGFLLAAINHAGLVSLTSTPLNCGPALRCLLNRPTSEKLTLLLPVGYPAKDCTVPDLQRKELKCIIAEY